MKKVPGVVSAYSGYTGGTTENPTYENYAVGGHREAVEVTYDPSALSLHDLLLHFVQGIDPTDGDGSFHDRGAGYAPAIFYVSDEEKRVAEEVLAEVALRFEKPLAVALLPRARFWPAEEYHQAYYQKNTSHYEAYRSASGRDAFREKYWGKEKGGIGGAQSAPPVQSEPAPVAYHKPTDEALRTRLTSLQYNVTQHEGTEPPFQNEYHDEHREGIYVDIVSGEPLFSSSDKYDSGTGWPSFVRPIAPDAITTREDRKLFTTRTEVRSKHADSHLGHVFSDGPQERGGMRYCMNSAALRFIPKEEMEQEGYGELLRLFAKTE